ncbi:MAG: hypothetical protein ACYTFK_12515 [Planctomycetota bacterium]|jgi:hypothetical protein
MRNKFKKIFLLVLIVGIVSLVLPGCKPKGEHPSKEKTGQEHPAGEHPSGSEHPTGGEHPSGTEHPK